MTFNGCSASQIDVIAPGLLVITEEFGEWEDSRRRIDLLALDHDANLVVIELKRTDDGGHMELQAIRYAAMVSKMTFEKVVDLHGRFLTRHGSSDDPQAAILGFLEWEEPDEDRFAQDVAIILVSADFSKELTTAVMWLNDHDLDIRCVRIKPYLDNGRTLIDVQQIIPLPEAIDYQIQIKEKEQKVRQDKSSGSHGLRRRFWESLLERAEQTTQLHANISPGDFHWVGTGSGVRGLAYNYVIYNHGSAVHLYIDRGSGQAVANKRAFDALQSEKDEIEKNFGGSLTWMRLDEKQACRIAYEMSRGGLKEDSSKWPAIQDEMIGAMTRFEKALSPHIARLKNIF